MQEIIKYITELGILVVLAALFIWRSIKTDARNSELLAELHKSGKLHSDMLKVLSDESANTQAAQTMLQKTIETNRDILEHHDRGVRAMLEAQKISQETKQ